MKVELWEDIMCPWCGIANERMNQALERFANRDGLEFMHRSFRTMPERPEGQSVDSAEYMNQAPGITQEMADGMVVTLQQLAGEVGLSAYHVADNKIGNTTLAHEFLAWATTKGKQNDAWDLLFRAYFGERAAIWSVDDLAPFADQLGLDSAEARHALETREYRTRVEGDHAEAVALGSRGVPFLVIDRKYGISGAQTVDTIVDALEKAWAERETSAA